MQSPSPFKFDYHPDPDNPGWHTWNLSDHTRFNGHALGPLIVRDEGASGARLRMMPGHAHTSGHNNVHGGAILALIDVGLFTGAALALGPVLGPALLGSVTLDLSTQFIGRAQAGLPLDVVTQLLKETGRLVFVRGLVEQGDMLVASFSGTQRKPSRS